MIPSSSSLKIAQPSSVVFLELVPLESLNLSMSSRGLLDDVFADGRFSILGRLPSVVEVSTMVSGSGRFLEEDA